MAWFVKRCERHYTEAVHFSHVSIHIVSVCESACFRLQNNLFYKPKQHVLQNDKNGHKKQYLCI